MLEPLSRAHGVGLCAAAGAGGPTGQPTPCEGRWALTRSPPGPRPMAHHEEAIDKALLGAEGSRGASVLESRTQKLVGSLAGAVLLEPRTEDSTEASQSANQDDRRHGLVCRPIP